MAIGSQQHRGGKVICEWCRKERKGWESEKMALAETSPSMVLGTTKLKELTITSEKIKKRKKERRGGK